MTINHLQNECFNLKGKWWLPNSDQMTSGELLYEEENMYLSLFGGLSDATVDSPFVASPDTRQHGMIYGELEDKTPVTILNSFYTNWTPDITSLSIPSGTKVPLRSSKLYCPTMFEGIHLSSQNEKISKCHVQIPYLDLWLNDAPFDLKINSSLSEVNLTYSRPKQQEFILTDQHCLIRFVHSTKIPSLPLSSAPEIKHTSLLEIEPSEPQTFDWFQSIISEIIDFLAIAYGGLLQSDRIIFYKSSSDQHGFSFYQCRHRVNVVSYDQRTFVVGYGKIRKSFQQILSGWLSLPLNFKQARNMLISSERRPSSFIELRFLPLVHAAEVLSNERNYSTIIPKTEFKSYCKEMLSSLPDDIPEELMKSISNSLGWANGRNLKGKLGIVLDELQDETCRLFSVDREQFIKGVVNTRNHYTHYSTKSGQNILQGVELHWAIQKLSLMIRILLMIQVGIKEDDVKTMIKSHVRLSQERSEWSKVSEEGSKYSISSE